MVTTACYSGSFTRYRYRSLANATVGEDEFGNRYYENYNPREEQPGRQRWVDLVQYDFNITQVPRPWASWLTQIRLDPPTKDEVVIQSQQPWQVKWNESL